MSKTKLAILVFCVAFGVNIAAFVFSKKAFLIDEVKNVWMYELPPTASPLDAYGAVDLGPQQGFIGTLFKPNLRPIAAGAAEVPVVETLLADSWTWNGKQKQLTVILKDKLNYSDASPILAEHFVQTAAWVSPFIRSFESPEWKALVAAKWVAKDPRTLVIEFAKLPPEFDLQKFLRLVLTHPLAGVIHPSNLAALKNNQKVTKEWISSGPYRIRKWNPKEITLVSRDDFPVMLQKEFFRQLRFQSAPVKNPSCEFMQAGAGEEKALEDHSLILTDQSVHVFWICRSWAQNGSFCANPQNRLNFAKMLSGKEERSVQTLVGSKVRYRIPQGSDPFRAKIREQIETEVKLMGGIAEEISYFFKPSTDADIELEFVVVAKDEHQQNLAESMAKLSSRLGQGSESQPNLVGEIITYPVNILMKHMRGDVYDRVFLLPDLDEKKVPI